MAKPVFYYCPRTRADTVMWMNEELGGVCDVKVVNLKSGEHKQPEFLKINPMGKVPALVHDGVNVTESAAICAYLADAFFDKGFAPPLNDPKRGAYFRWMFYAPSCIEPMMLDKLGGVKRENPMAAGYGTEADVLKSIDVALSAGPYILGDKVSAADIVMGSLLNFATMFGAIEKKGKIADYIDRMTARPACVKMQEISAKYASELGL
ncbi:glutathione S-transferase family protein [Hyphococcus sp.]|jgi:glutathione S-transferase|uniref:glutathione S-transferase family protein n=1 Tax=Hyphococcus sp. TaxID=2038636 RepID=UPI003D135892